MFPASYPQPLSTVQAILESCILHLFRNVLFSSSKKHKSCWSVHRSLAGGITQDSMGTSTEDKEWGLWGHIPARNHASVALHSVRTPPIKLFSSQSPGADANCWLLIIKSGWVWNASNPASLPLLPWLHCTLPASTCQSGTNFPPPGWYGKRHLGRCSRATMQCLQSMPGASVL